MWPPCEKLWPFEFVESFCCLISSARYVMRLNRTSELKVMAIWISRELPVFNFERLDKWCTRIGHSCEKLGPLEFLESFVVQFRASRYVMCLNRTSEWKVLTIRNSRELPLFNFKRLDMWCAWIRHPRENWWPFEFLESFHCSISSISICNVPESDIRVKSYDLSNF